VEKEAAVIAKSPPKRRTRVLVAIAVSIAVVAASALLIWKVLWDLDHPPLINITRGDYDRALAKWREQKIEEYEITTHTQAFAGGTLTLHVSDYGNKVEQLAPNVRPASVLTAQDIEYLKRDTVEGLFAKVDRILAESNESKKSAAYLTEDFYMAYKVSFHPDIGYPQRVSERPITKPGFYISDIDRDTRVTNLKIIKQGK
jgi:hypothetical protein